MQHRRQRDTAPATPRDLPCVNAAQSVPYFARERFQRFQAEWALFEQGLAPQPQKQIQVAVPDCPKLFIQIYMAGSASWRLDFIDPASRKWTSCILGKLSEMSVPAAMVAYQDAQDRLAEGRSPKAGKHTFNQVMWAVVFPNAKARGKKSIAGDIAKYKCVFETTLGPLRLDQITPRVLEGEAARVRSTKGPVTAERYIAALRSWCRDIHDLGVWSQNPARGVKIRQNTGVSAVVASNADLARIGAVLRNGPASVENDFFEGLMYTGTRVSELRLAKFSDVDEVAGVIRCQETKSGTPQDIVLSTAFMQVYARRKAGRRNDYLFPANSGEGAMPYPRGAFKRLLERAGVTGLTMHAFRRAFGTAGIQSPGVSVHDVSKLLRHSSTRVTETHYLVASDSRLRHAANKAAGLIRQKLGFGLADGNAGQASELKPVDPTFIPLD